MLKSDLKASIVIPTYNRAKLLNYTLNSIANQCIDKRLIEVIIVDDGSTDNTYSVVNTYKSKMKVRYFFQEDKGYRPGSARNVGIKNAEGDIIVFVDSGILLSSRCVLAHINAHSSDMHPTVVLGYVYCYDQGNENEDILLKLIAPNSPDKSIRYFNSTATFLDLREEYYIKYKDNINDLPAPWAYFWTCNVSVSRNFLIKEVGMFDPKFDGRWGIEDVELGYRLSEKGAKFKLNRNADSIHYPHTKVETKKSLEEEINTIYFHKKHQSFETQLLLSCKPIELNDMILECASNKIH